VTDTRPDALRFIALSLALSECPRLVKAVRERFASPAEAFASSPAELRSLGFDEDRIREFFSEDLRGRAEKEFDRLAKNGYSLLTFEDVDYPVELREIFDPPFVLYCAGRTEALRGPAVAIVGARRPSPYGRAVAGRLAEDLSSRGLIIVSGMARGIDAFAHEGALKGGRTVAVLGSGLGRIYPPENRRLFDRIIGGGGTVVTEYPLDGEPLGFHFPQRNRIISGLSLGLIVIEATRRSGSLISAMLALEQGREVMAVPGNVTSALSGGTNGLIKIGAKLVESWEDAAEELPSPVREVVLARREGETRPLPLLTDEEAAVLALLKPDEAATVDELLESCGRPVPEILVSLLNLEIKGFVVPGPGRSYMRRL
jgi:DNA processing protein